MPPAVPISKKLVLINSASGVMTRMLNVVVVLWWMQHLLKRVPPEEYALLPVLVAVMAFIPLLSTVLTGGLSRYITEAYARHDDRRITEITSTMACLLLGAGLLLAVGGLIFAWHVDIVPNIRPQQLNDARLMMALLILQAALTLALAPFSVGMFVRQKFVLMNVIELAATVIRVVLLLVLLLGIGPQVKWVVVAQFVAAILHILVRTVVSCRVLPALRFRRDHMRSDVLWPILRFNIWNVLMQAAGMIRNAANTLVLQSLATPVDVNAFSLGSRADKQIREMSLVATQPVQPALTAMHATNQRERMANAYLRGGRLTLWAIMSVAVPVLIFREEFFSLYLAQRFTLYRDCATVTLLLLLAYPFLYARVMLHKIAIAEGRVALLAICMLVLQTCNLGLSIYLVGWRGLGGPGAALSTLITSVVGNLLVYWPMGVHKFGVPLGRFLRQTVFAGLVPALAGAATCELARILIAPAEWMELFAAALLGLFGYFSVLWLFCLQSADRLDIEKVMKRIWPHR